MINRNAKPLIFIVLILLLITACITFNAAEDSKSQNAGSNISTPAQKANEPAYRGDGGKGIVIAVPTPVMQNNTQADNWMPQLFQDLMTGDLARFSAMTVIDRSNEKMVLAEQNLSASGNYSDSDYIRMGNLTNAQFIVAGSIQNITGRYNVSFRINNTETNEIKASFNKAYGLTDIETGLAAKEAVKELLAGLGIELTENGERALLAIQPVEARSAAYLARGMAAANSDNIVESLAFLSEALNSDSTRNEANRHIQSFFGDFQTASIQERANYAIAQKERWDKIFSDLDEYMWRNLPVFIYDFSNVEDKIDIRQNRVTLTIKPGIKVVPDRTALLVYKTIVDNWLQIRQNPENSVWTSNVRMPRLADSGGPTGLYSLSYGYFSYDIGLYDDYGDRIERHRWYGGSPNISINYFKNDADRSAGKADFQVLAQHKYYQDAVYRPIMFTVSLNNVTDRMSPRIEQVSSNRDYQGQSRVNYPVMSTLEWQDWLSQRTATR